MRFRYVQSRGTSSPTGLESLVGTVMLPEWSDRDPRPPGWRVSFAHHRIVMEDGLRTGLSVGGSGVPLVFFHGFGLNRLMYLRLLNRLPHLGFLVVAIDAPGHGGSTPLPREQDTFTRRVDVAEQVLARLGIERAVLVGHSMGGRVAAELAARRPDVALAAILVDPALGDDFDDARSRLRSPVKTGFSLAAGLADFACDRVGLRNIEHVRHAWSLGGPLVQFVTRPGDFVSAARAIMTAEISAVALRQLATNGTSVAIVHGEKDLLVPLRSAVGAASTSNATLVTLPRAYHSWVLTTPWTFTAIMSELINGGRLGPDFDDAQARKLGGSPEPDQPGPLYTHGAPVLSMAPPLMIIGAAQPRRPHLYHPFKVWGE